jgi:hypothetical protein
MVIGTMLVVALAMFASSPMRRDPARTPAGISGGGAIRSSPLFLVEAPISSTLAQKQVGIRVRSAQKVRINWSELYALKPGETKSFAVDFGQGRITSVVLTKSRAEVNSGLLTGHFPEDDRGQARLMFDTTETDEATQHMSATFEYKGRRYQLIGVEKDQALLVENE